MPASHSTSIAVLGATGNLGRQICAQALERGWALSVGVRNRNRLPPGVAAKAEVVDVDLASTPIEPMASWLAGRDVLVFCAGVVTQGEAFVSAFDKAVSAVESLPADQRPVCWFLAGAALLPLDSTGRLGVDLPKVRDTYGPHRQNHQRLLRTDIDWRLLCPGPMVDQPPMGRERLRLSIEGLPAPLPGVARLLPSALVLPLFALTIPQMIVPYADASAVMLDHVKPGDACSRRRVGLALPVGMKGRKDQWAAKARAEG